MKKISINCLDDVLEIPNYRRGAFKDISRGIDIYPLHSINFIYVVYQNSMDNDDTLIEVRAMKSPSFSGPIDNDGFSSIYRAVPLTREFISKMFSGLKWIEMNGHFLFKDDAQKKSNYPSENLIRETRIRRFISSNGNALSCAFCCQDKLNCLSDAQEAFDCIMNVYEFKSAIKENGHLNREIESLNEKINYAKEQMASYDELLKKAHDKNLRSLDTFSRYGLKIVERKQ